LTRSKTFIDEENNNIKQDDKIHLSTANEKKKRTDNAPLNQINLLDQK
jgi:hypothetical protein